MIICFYHIVVERLSVFYKYKLTIQISSVGFVCFVTSSVFFLLDSYLFCMDVRVQVMRLGRFIDVCCPGWLGRRVVKSTFAFGL